MKPSVIKITGVRSSKAQAEPLAALATPGPFVVKATPIEPVSSAVAEAIITAPVSVLVSTNLMPS